MSTTQEQEIAILTDKLNALENESRRILRALNWASKVRLILVCLLVLFVVVSVFLFYRLYNDVLTRRIPEVQNIINNSPERFSEPLMQQIQALAEEQGPYVAEVFRDQAEKDSKLYLEAFDQERTVLIGNLQSKLETKLTDTYASIIDEQEQLLLEEFPVLKDKSNMANVRDNMTKIYDKIGERYYVDYLKEELEEMAGKMDTFPSAEPRLDDIPVSEQVATEFLELVRLMLINSDHYVIPEDELAALETRAIVKPKDDGKTESDSDDTKSNDSEDSDSDDAKNDADDDDGDSDDDDSDGDETKDDGDDAKEDEKKEDDSKDGDDTL